MEKWNKEINMNLSHRDIEIFKICLPMLMKQLKRNSKLESQVFGTNVIGETLDYCEHLQRCIDAALLNEVMAANE